MKNHSHPNQNNDDRLQSAPSEDRLILVDAFDNPIGEMGKTDAHAEGRLHRAFSVFVIGENGMLVQRRASNKYHSGGLIANACCSHPRVGESLTDAVARRMTEELGLNCPVKEIFSFVYRAPVGDGLIEYEYDHVFLGRYDGEVRPNPDEIDEVLWFPFDTLSEMLLNTPEQFAPWFVIAAPRVIKGLTRGAGAR